MLATNEACYDVHGCDLHALVVTLIYTWKAHMRPDELFIISPSFIAQLYILKSHNTRTIIYGINYSLIIVTSKSSNFLVNKLFA